MIRKYKAVDLEALIITWRQAFILAHPFLDTQFVNKVQQDIREIYMAKAETWVYIDQNKLVGFISMLDNEVGAIFIQPSFHSKGIGSQLMNFVARLHLELEVEVFKDNMIGTTFYKKYGFVLLKEYMHEPTNQIVQRLVYQNPGN